MRRWLQEPLVHFLLLGAVLFVAFSWKSGHPTGDARSIVVTQGRIEHLANTFVLTWQRPPTQQEMDGLIQEYVREEVYAREAMALGLDRDDLIIRRRLRQKLEFVSEDLAEQVEPSDEALQGYLKAHPASFAAEPQFTFRQVYLNPKRHGANLAHDADRLLADLKQVGDNTNVAAFGDPFPLEHEFENAPAREVRNAFGERFAATLADLSPGQWQGPVESGYGVHVVFLSERTKGRLPPLEDVRDGVHREWANARRLEANEKRYEAMLKHYVVTIERAQAAEKKRFPEAKAK